ncbi:MULTISPECIES: hypothetical protein [unclassified Nocardia]|uniref:hypothetical protein n=1 Tax=unclassified Nocardia TaxID=2637762 RepID=UPI001CE3E5FE|nr:MULTISPECIES: hypothetical protein [unclassified Nocardia]
MSQQIREIVEQTWHNHIGLPPEWTPTQTEEFLARETAAICSEIDRRTTSAQPQAIQRWKAEHGQEPDYLTTVGLLNNTRQSITEQVLTEALYEKIPPEPQDVLETPDAPTDLDEQVDAAQRWRDPMARTPDPDPDLDELADRLLPHRSTLVRVMAAHLLQVMREDGQPLPTGPDDPAVAPFTNRLEQGMQADGQPLDGPGALATP